MKLVLDFGNTLKKFALFEGNNLVKLEIISTKDTGVKDFTEDFVKNFSYVKARSAILSSVVDLDQTYEHYLSEHFNLLNFNHQTSLPVKIKYKTPQTLGKDRLAIASASSVLFKGKNVLAIVTGSCITYDFIDQDAVYHGGAISPGMPLRFKALHNFTDHLPLLEGRKDNPLIGSSTEESIRSGVIHGMRAEIDGIIDRYRAIYENLTVIISGGDLNYFDKSLKNNIFAIPNLVLTGLNIILDFNEKS